MFIKDLNFCKNQIEEIKEYKCNPIKFEEIDQKCKKIFNSSGCKDLIRDLDNEIDLDFIKESEEIEGLNDGAKMEFLKSPDTKILHALPAEILLAKNYNSDNESKEFVKDIFKKTKLIAINAKSKTQKNINYKSHLYALKNLFDLAKKSKLTKHRKGKFTPLTHADILETNLYLDENGNEFSNFGRYRSPYSSSFTKVDGATWVPVSNARVSDNMDALIEWYNNNSENLHPFIRAAILHAEFIRIHPFADGNGRTARLLMNYELIRNGYPSVVIKSRDKIKYFNALNTAITTKDITELVTIIKEACNETANKYLEIIKTKKFYDKENE